MPDIVSLQITQMLIDWSQGDEFALEQLIPLVYEELRRMARRKLYPFTKKMRETMFMVTRIFALTIY